MELKTPLKLVSEAVPQFGRSCQLIDADGSPWFCWVGSEAQEQFVAELVRRANAHDQLVEALQWYVENDDVNEMPGNEWFIAGRDKAKAALAAAKGGA